MATAKTCELVHVSQHTQVKGSSTHVLCHKLCADYLYNSVVACLYTSVVAESGQPTLKKSLVTPYSMCGVFKAVQGSRSRSRGWPRLQYNPAVYANRNLISGNVAAVH